jgi:release factor glutamine methyltransferase
MADVSIQGWLSSHAELPHRDLELLLQYIASIPKAKVLTSPQEKLPPQTLVKLERCADKLSDGQPLAYVLGHWEFWGLELAVTPNVLIPRPESETLVEFAVKHAANGARVLDLGTGSGAIAIALKHERPDVCVTATDIHSSALATARCNARRHGCEIEFAHSNWFDALNAKWDLIVSNPPYIAEADPHLPDLVHEPAHALTAGHDGMQDIRNIILKARDYLNPHGVLALEHGYDQAGAVVDLLHASGFTGVDSIDDLAGIPRVTHGARGASADG